MIRVPMTIEAAETSVGMSVEGGSREVSLDVDHVTSPVQIDFSADAETLPAGSDVDVEYSQKHFHFAIPQGEKGEKGDKGDPGNDGYSPSASVSKSGNTSTLTVTDKTGTTSVEILDGEGGGLVILSYGNSTWAEFIAAYETNSIVYCRASSGSNPGSGAQTRLAFMAYINSETPTEVEFQYYRSVSSHSATQQGDQVYVYKLNKTSGWSVTTREAYTKIVAGTSMGSAYSNGALTLNFTGSIPSSAADVGAIAAPSSPATGAFLVYNGSAWTAQTLSIWQGGNY